MLTGNGMWIWRIVDCEGGSPEAIARKAKAAGLSHVLIKIADGAVAFNFSNRVDLVPAVTEALRAQNISVWGWQYVYGANPIAEANQARDRMQALNLDGFVIDAEAEYKKRPTEAGVYTQALRNMLHVPIALSSYRFPSLHPEFPWQAFLQKVDLVMPQVYWMQATNAGYQLNKSVAAFRALAPGLPIVPTGAAFHEHGWEATPAEIAEFAHVAAELGMPAINWWEWGNAVRYGLWDAVAAVWRTTEPPAEGDEQEAAPGIRLRVQVDLLNVRTGPGTNYPRVDQLRRGETIDVLGVGGKECWVQISENPVRWVCVQLGAAKYLGGV